MVSVGVGIHLLENGGDISKNSCIKKSCKKSKVIKNKYECSSKCYSEFKDNVKELYVWLQITANP